jgi:hypothetical protein
MHAPPLFAMKQLLFGYPTINAAGIALLLGICLRLIGWLTSNPTITTTSYWLMTPFLALLAILVLIVAPYTWLTSSKP